FALALWDSEQQVLLLARDRYGIKPLYYSCSRSVFAFGSEIKALLPQPAIGTSIDRDGLVEYLTFQNFFTDRTIFADVKLLPAASVLRIGWNGAPSIHRYWDYRFRDRATPFAQADAVPELH